MHTIMSSSSGGSRWRWRAAGTALATGALVAAAVSGAADPAADAAEPVVRSAPASDCPAAFPLSNVVEGLAVAGLTVSHGTEPGGFTGKIVGRIDDGIAPGVDMIIARLSGSEITDPDTGDVWRGIWAGMSGSPVYAPDGRLIGAVAYGLSYSPSDYAGITPAAQMYRVRDYPSSAAASNRAAEVPAGIARRMTADGVSDQAVAAGYHRLPMPRTISGLPADRMRRVTEQADYSGRRGLVAGFRATADEEPIPVVPGGNLVASQSYGDITSAGTGTATAICDGDVLGFGHPFALLGRASYSMHGADALYIETDLFGGSFKVAKPAAPIGQVTQDRLAAILGVAGRTPPSTTVTSQVTATNGNERHGTTTITESIYPDDVPYFTVNHLLVNEDRVFDAYAAGSATLRWTVEMERADGNPLRFTRRDTYANAADLTYATIWDLYGQVRRIVSNRFADVEVTDIHVRSSLDHRYRAFELGTVQRLVDGHWRTLTPGGTIRAKSGGTLRLRAWLEPRRGSASVGRWAKLQVPVGSFAAKRLGELTVSGGQSTSRAAKPGSLRQLLAAMSKAPANASVWGQLRVRTPDGPRHRLGHTATPAVVDGAMSVRVRVAP